MRCPCDCCDDCRKRRELAPLKPEQIIDPREILLRKQKASEEAWDFIINKITISGGGS